MSEAMTAVDDSRPPIEHELKTWQSYFHALADGSKNFELRRDDRDYRPGDTLWLRETEYGGGAYTGRETRRLVTYVLRHEEDLGLIDGFAILSLESTQLSQALRERDELSADLLKVREATRVRPSKKAMNVVRETLEAMEAMDEEDAPALRLLVEMYDKLEG